MSRLYGRTTDIYSISKYLMENYNRKYEKDNTPISYDDLEKTFEIIGKYLPEDGKKYLADAEIEVSWNLFTKDTIYSGYGEEKNAIIFPTKQLKEDYRRDLVYFSGDLLRRINLDYMPDFQDIRCQYSDVLPLLLEYLFLKELRKEDRFSDRHLQDLKLNAKEYIKIYEAFKEFPKHFSEERFLSNSLLFLVPLSSMDVTLQLTDDIIEDSDELKSIIKELIDNEHHNREEVINKRNLDTYGFKRLRKEISGRR